MSKKMTTEEFISKAKEVHGDKYDYSKTVYVNPKKKVTIVCHIHGMFEQAPYSHLSGCGCKMCGKEKSIKSKTKWDKDSFIIEARKVHGDKYDYSKLDFINMETPVTIICPKHGNFKQIPRVHLLGSGCPKCVNKNFSFSDFVLKAHEVHGYKYDYSKSNFINLTTPIIISCPIHGDFKQAPNKHLNGCKCPKCATEQAHEAQKSNTAAFIRKANKVHGDRYDYSKVNYINNIEKVCIICPEHGEFWQTPSSHLKGTGCPICNGKFKRTNEQFILEAKKIHGEKYDYSKVNYVNANTPVTIICPIHGEFTQKPVHHLNRKHGCPLCSPTPKKDTERFIEESRKVHGNKYDYSKVKYKNIFEKITIICPTHGEFQTDPHHHLLGCGCPKCAKEARLGKSNYTQNEIIEKFKEVHGDKYDYSKVKYTTVLTPVCIICPKHGEFWQIPSSHYNGRGCPVCSAKHLEIKVHNLLTNSNIAFNTEKKFDWLSSPNNGKMRLDFYLPEHNIAIECQGVQHYQPVDYFGGEEQFKKQKVYDSQKYKLCKKNGVRVLYFTDESLLDLVPKKYKDITFTSVDDLLAEIKQCKA